MHGTVQHGKKMRKLFSAIRKGAVPRKIRRIRPKACPPVSLFKNLCYTDKQSETFCPSGASKKGTRRRGTVRREYRKGSDNVEKPMISREDYARRVQDARETYYRMAYCYVKNADDALDIVSEGVCKGLRELPSLRQPEYFDTWMTRIVINAALDWLRKNARCSTVEDAVLEALPADEGALRPEDAMDLYAALDALSEKDKTCVVLRYFEDHSFAEIADILDEPEPSVKSRLYRALKKMRAYLEKGGAEQ